MLGTVGRNLNAKILWRHRQPHLRQLCPVPMEACMSLYKSQEKCFGTTGIGFAML